MCHLAGQRALEAQALFENRRIQLTIRGHIYYKENYLNRRRYADPGQFGVTLRLFSKYREYHIVA
jgi:hypothetical protein